jgi:hypothetical protein
MALILSISGDTTRLPVNKGLVMNGSNYKPDRDFTSCVKVTSDNNIYSCSFGLVTNVLKVKNKYDIIIKTNELTYCYSNLDSACVVRKQRVSKYEILGAKFIKDEDDFIIFYVYKNNLEINSRKFITFLE